MSLKVNWCSEDKPVNQTVVEQRIIEEVSRIMQGKSIDKLVFHTVILTNNIDGPTVHVEPGEVPGTLDCYYAAKAKWTSIDQWPED